MGKFDIISVLTKGGLSSAGIALIGQAILFFNTTDKINTGYVVLGAGVVCLILREIFKIVNKEEPTSPNEIE